MYSCSQPCTVSARLQYQMGNQLCPANNKELIENFKYAQKSNQSVSDIVANYLKHNKNNDSLDLSQSVNHGSEFIFTPVIKLRPQDILSSFEVDDSRDRRESAQFGPSELNRSNKELSGTVTNLQLEDGWNYNGAVRKGLPQGEGEEQGPNGEYYKGQFKEGLKCGTGEYKFSNEATYRGQFRDNSMYGQGVFQFANGDCFEGQFVNNVREGKGKYIPLQPNIDGILYFEGEYHNDVKNGPGKMVYDSGQVKGIWKDDSYDYSFSL